MKRPTDDKVIALAAKLYYLEGLGQGEVAKLLSLSQAQISRLLKKAREKGIVKIEVSESFEGTGDLEKRLKDTFGLEFVKVIKVPTRSSTRGGRSVVGYLGAKEVGPVLINARVIGISGGRTLRELVRHLALPGDIKTERIVQLMGNVAPDVADYDATEIGRTLAAKASATLYSINAPAIAKDRKVRDVFLRHEQVSAVWNIFPEIEVALVGIGTLEDSVFIDNKNTEKIFIRVSLSNPS